MASTRFVYITLALAGVAAFGNPVARAGHHPRRPDIDIEKLRPEIWRGGSDWALRIRYKVEIENPPVGERFDLVLRLTERGRVVRGPEGRPIEIIVPLRRPSEIEHDEIEFESTVRAVVDGAAICNPKHLRAVAIVVPAGGGPVLDHKDHSVKYRHHHHRHHHHHHYHVYGHFCGHFRHW